MSTSSYTYTYGDRVRTKEYVRTKYWSEEEWAEIFAQIDAGHPKKKVAELHNMSVMTLYRRLKTR